MTIRDVSASHRDTLAPATASVFGEHDDRVEAVLATLSWTDKLGQLQIGYRPRLKEAEELVRGGIGAIFWPRSAAATIALQRIAVQETPHGIPLLATEVCREERPPLRLRDGSWTACHHAEQVAYR